MRLIVFAILSLFVPSAIAIRSVSGQETSLTIVRHPDEGSRGSGIGAYELFVQEILRGTSIILPHVVVAESIEKAKPQSQFIFFEGAPIVKFYKDVTFAGLAFWYGGLPFRCARVYRPYELWYRPKAGEKLVLLGSGAPWSLQIGSELNREISVNRISLTLSSFSDEELTRRALKDDETGRNFCRDDRIAMQEADVARSLVNTLLVGKLQRFERPLGAFDAVSDARIVSDAKTTRVEIQLRNRFKLRYRGRISIRCVPNWTTEFTCGAADKRSHSEQSDDFSFDLGEGDSVLASLKFDAVAPNVLRRACVVEVRHLEIRSPTPFFVEPEGG